MIGIVGQVDIAGDLILMRKSEMKVIIMMMMDDKGLYEVRLASSLDYNWIKEQTEIRTSSR